jgi:hypothetical protein
MLLPVRADEARALLGVDGGATAAEIRAAWRRAMRGSHPDVAAGPDAGPRTARLNEAYAVLRAAPVPMPASAPPAAPEEDSYLTLLEAAHRVGDVTYVDRQAGLLELLVDLPDVGPCSVLVTLQGRRAFVAVDSLSDPGWNPSAEQLAAVTRSLAGA